MWNDQPFSSNSPKFYHNLGPMPLVKKTRTLLWQLISRGKEENQRKFAPLMFDLNEKQWIIFFLTAFGLQVVPIPWKKNTKLITTLRRWVGNCGSLSNMNLKYHVSITMQILYSNSIMCLVTKPLTFPLVECFLCYLVY